MKEVIEAPFKENRFMRIHHSIIETLVEFGEIEDVNILGMENDSGDFIPNSQSYSDFKLIVHTNSGYEDGYRITISRKRPHITEDIEKVNES